MFEVSTHIWSGKDAGKANRPTQVLIQDASIVATHTCLLPPATTALSSWDALPEHLLVQILQHVPVQDRFRHCALVATAWAAAAIDSTTDVCMPGRCADLLNLQSWLVKHGSQLTTVTLTGQVDYTDQEVVVMPCAKLRQLDLRDVTLQLVPTVGGLFPGVLRDLGGLTRLTLQHVAVVGGPQALTGLAGLTGLQHLTLSDLDTKQASAVNSDWFPVPGAIFSTLGSLTHLELDKCVAGSTLEHLEHLTNLQHLVLSRLGVHHVAATALSGLSELSRRLVWLCIEGLESTISTVSMPGLGQCTRLARLQLLNCKGFQPILLSGMMDLQVLDIQGTPLLGTGGVVEAPAGPNAAGAGANAAGPGPGAAAAAGNGNPAPAPAPAGDQQAAAQAGVQAAAAGAAALLLELPKLQKLTALSLVQILWAHALGQPPAAYAALTASSSLCTLDLSFSLIPSQAWRSMFDPGARTLPNLRSLSILCTQAPISDADLALLVRCCPGLRSLGLKGTVQEGSGLEPLLDLTALTSLSVNHVSSSGVLAVLGELRGLQDLQISVLSSVTAAGLLQLSSLRGLTRLRVESSPETWIAQYGMVLLSNKAPPGCPPDVWAQLQRWCLSKIAQHRPAVVPLPEKERKANPVLRWLVRCVTE